MRRNHNASKLRIMLGVSTAALSCAACATGPLEVTKLTSEPAGQTAQAQLETGSIQPMAAADRAGEPAKSTGTASGHADPVASALARAHELRSSGRKKNALEVLNAAAETQPENRQLLVSRGLLALELGDLSKAAELLKKAEDDGEPDWRVLSGLGSTYAAMGKQAEAQSAFARALRLKPDHPSVLNNLALSYALDGKTSRAEAVLRQAANANGADARTRKNLALLLGLDGQQTEAEAIAATVMPAQTAKANVSYLEILRRTEHTAQTSKAQTSKAQTANAAAVREAASGLGGPRQ